MKKDRESIKNMDVDEINKEVVKMRNEVAKFRVESAVNKPKDTNELSKKQKRLARLLMSLSQRQALDELKQKQAK